MYEGICLSQVSRKTVITRSWDYRNMLRGKQSLSPPGHALVSQKTIRLITPHWFTWTRTKKGGDTGTGEWGTIQKKNLTYSQSLWYPGREESTSTNVNQVRLHSHVPSTVVEVGALQWTKPMWPLPYGTDIVVGHWIKEEHQQNNHNDRSNWG